jgi:hypothetical protein
MSIKKPYLVRHTQWYEGANVVQVSVAILDLDWEPLACVTEHVGPFDSAEVITRFAQQAAVNLARGQLSGQQELELT